MAVVAKKAGVAKATAPKTVKSKAPPKPKFGELGYIFNVQAKIIEVHPEGDDCFYPFTIELDLGDFENLDSHGKGIVTVEYETKKSLTEVVTKTSPALTKSIKLDELNKAKAEVARLTKELAAIK